mgnify:CR=1 FL=1
MMVEIFVVVERRRRRKDHLMLSRRLSRRRGRRPRCGELRLHGSQTGHERLVVQGLEQELVEVRAGAGGPSARRCQPRHSSPIDVADEGFFSFFFFSLAPLLCRTPGSLLRSSCGHGPSDLRPRSRERAEEAEEERRGGERERHAKRERETENGTSLEEAKM